MVMLDSYNITQHVFAPTLNSNHTLDQIISRADESHLVQNSRIHDPDQFI